MGYVVASAQTSGLLGRTARQRSSLVDAISIDESEAGLLPPELEASESAELDEAQALRHAASLVQIVRLATPAFWSRLLTPGWRRKAQHGG